MTHVTDVKVDRAKGFRTEVDFCREVINHGLIVAAAHPAVLAACGLDPELAIRDESHGDVLVRGTIGLQLHEVKWKGPNQAGEYGLETYRLDGLLAACQRYALAYYTIFDKHAASWVTIGIHHLSGLTLLRESGARASTTKSWHGGVAQTEPIWYWPVRHWRPLASIWAMPRVAPP